MKADLDTTKTDVIAPFLSIQKYGLRSRGWGVKVFLLKTDYSIKRSLSWSSGQISWVLSWSPVVAIREKGKGCGEGSQLCRRVPVRSSTGGFAQL